MSGDEIIALTGASGFVGGHVLRLLVRKRRRVRVLVRDPARLRVPQGGAGEVEILTGGLEDTEALKALVRGVAVVVHVAGAIAACRREDFFRVNVEGSRNLALAAGAEGTGKFVFVSSLAAREPALSAYAASKRLAEEAVREAAAETGMRTVILRPPAVYGPGDRATLPLFDQLTRSVAILPGHARQRLSLIHVEDLAAALVHLALMPANEATGDVPLEIDDGRKGGYAWADLAKAAARATGRPRRLLHLPRGLVRAAGAGAGLLSRLLGRPFVLSAEKANELYHDDWVARSPKVQERTDWTPRLQFAEGFRDTLEWYVRAGWLPASRLRGAVGLERD